MSDMNVDFIGKEGGQGEVAANLMTNGLNVGKMRPYIGADGNTYVTIYKGGDPNKAENYSQLQVNSTGTLRRDEWVQLDEALLGIAESRLAGVQDLVSRGLVFNLGNAMGTTVLEHHTVSDAMEANLSMDGVTRGLGDRPNFKTNYLPIPIIHVDYEINTRVLEASRKLGNPLDTTSVERAGRRVAEQLEKMLFTNVDYSFAGGDIKSYLNYGDRNTASFTAWTTSGKTGAQIITDVLAWKQASINAYHYGPWMLYVPTAYETKLDADYDATTPGTTIRERILKIGGIEDVKVIDTLTDGNALLVQMTSDVVRLVRGMGIQNVQWQTEAGFVNKFKVMTIQVPQIRSDYNGKCGIVHASV